MSNEKNFFVRTVEAMVASRERSAQRYVARYQRDLGLGKDEFTKR
ncbi:hypothetical protein PSC71_18130 [Devosia sp. J2-20]|jgi:hypothetical protein|nr:MULTISPECIES: hypothetical protein [Devosia]MCZ4345793.1 hypothetical protein [Devosia neptuniae]WDQ99072.1 hypothetical protein PSC71_18130 [Devosia sp. J2-20]|tara:strand:- start:6655 stop:6789 length:135 start_codon:yes stop_codon:yes gene_type:complete